MGKYSLTKSEKELAKKSTQPGWAQPSLAKLTHEYFSDPDWIYERKLDGVRCLTFKKDGEIKILSRNKNEKGNTYPEIATALKKQQLNFIADGEIVTFDGAVTSFAKLQARVNVRNPGPDLVKKVPVYYYIFDLLYFDGYDISKLDLRERKHILKKSLQFEDPIRYCTHINRKGEAFLQEACEKDWEGIIAKDATKPYMHSRTTSWLKFKCVNRQELVIGGFTEPQGERIGFGALLVGYYQHDEFKYAGKVGTGYSDAELNDMHSKMKPLERKTSPFSEEINQKNIHWITPKLVAEIGFTEWTTEGKLRHPRYIGLRFDKSPSNVVRES